MSLNNQSQTAPSDAKTNESNIGSTVLISSQGFSDLVGSNDGKNLHWTTDINSELPIKMAAYGMSANIKPETIPSVLNKAAAMRGDNPAVHVMRNKKQLTWTWR